MDEFWDLHCAADTGDRAEATRILDAGADLNAFDEMGFTPLHYAAWKGHLELTRFFIARGAKVNAHDESHIGNTPLSEIAGECSFEMAKLLVESGADPTIRGWMQLNALDRAAQRKKDEGRKVYDLLCRAAARFQADQ